MTRPAFGGLTMAAVFWAAWLVSGAGSAGAQATGPAFDCAKATGAIEKLICGDEKLATLDRRLEGVYRAAMAKAKDGMGNTLRAEQRGWVKGRDECWKATGPDNAVFLTESWQATSEHECVEAQYRLRTSELQVRWQLVPAKKPVYFGCNNNPANEVVATFFETDPPAARFERGDRTVVAWQVRSADGAKYEGQNLSFWNKGSKATVTWLGDELKCQVK